MEVPDKQSLRLPMERASHIQFIEKQTRTNCLSSAVTVGKTQIRVSNSRVVRILIIIRILDYNIIMINIRPSECKYKAPVNNEINSIIIKI